MPDALTLLVMALATQRTLFLWFAAELFRPVRIWIAKLGSWPAYLVECPICMSIWVGGFVVGVWYAGGVLFLVVLALSTLASPVHRLLLWLEHLGFSQGPSPGSDQLASRLEALEATTAALQRRNGGTQ